MIQYSERTKRTPSAAEKTKRKGNHQAKLHSALKPRSDSAPTTTDAPSNGSTPVRAASRGTKGITATLANPATAVLIPIPVLETPMRSISSERSGIDRLKATPTAATLPIAAASERTRRDENPSASAATVTGVRV